MTESEAAVFHVENQPLFIGKLKNSLLKLSFYLISGKGAVLFHPCNEQLAYILDRNEKPSPFFFKRLQAFVGSDPVNLREQPRIFR